MKKLFQVINFINNHPLTIDNRLKAYLRFVNWQITSSISKDPSIIPFVENSKLIVKKGMTGATGNIYTGLHEFEDMAFLLHFLRKEDVFGDIGANIGSYTILASAVVNAKSVTIEPIPTTFKCLTDNIKINHLESLVVAFNKAVGEIEGILRFTKDLDTINHVIIDHNKSSDTIEVPVVTMDHLFTNDSPMLIKIDVEGFELSVLKGGENVLRSEELKAIIIELNGSGARYGILDKDVHDHLLSYNFLPYKYNPFNRNLEEVSKSSESGNTIYVKDKEYVKQRLASARMFSVIGKSF